MNIMQFCVGIVGTNCYIVYDENTKEAAVIDPGDNAPSILKAVRDEKLSLKYILLTHAHFDHILAAHEIIKETEAKYVVPEADTWLLNRDNMGIFRSEARGYIEDVPDIKAREGTEISFGGITASYMSTPGHTPGSCVIKIGDTLFTGDTLFSGSCGRCDLEGGNYREMLSSLKRLYELEGDYKVLPGHESVSTLEHERKYNPYMQEAIKR